MKKLILLVSVLVNITIKPVWADDKEALSQIYSTIKNEYIEKVDMEKLVMNGLKGLNKMDKNLRAANDKNRISVYYKGNVKQVVSKPQDFNEIDNLVKFTLKVMKAVAKTSPQIEVRDFEMVDYIVSEACESLDKDTHYYPDLDIGKDEKVKLRRYFYSRDLGNDLVYVKIGAFNPYTKKNMEEEIKKYPNIKGLVLDLRGNPGGVLNEAIETAKLFLDEGIIVSSKGRGGQPVKLYNSEKGDIMRNKPIVILVDEKTASSAEVLAGALKDQSRAKVVGTRTQGKGTIQKVIAFDNESRIALTNATLYTPSDEPINKKGIVPDVCLKGALELDNPEKLVKTVIKDCQRESREKENIDIEVARFLLQ